MTLSSTTLHGKAQIRVENNKVETGGAKVVVK